MKSTNCARCPCPLCHRKPTSELQFAAASDCEPWKRRVVPLSCAVERDISISSLYPRSVESLLRNPARLQPCRGPLTEGPCAAVLAVLNRDKLTGNESFEGFHKKKAISRRLGIGFSKTGRFSNERMKNSSCVSRSGSPISE